MFAFDGAAVFMCFQLEKLLLLTPNPSFYSWKLYGVFAFMAATAIGGGFLHSAGEHELAN